MGALREYVKGRVKQARHYYSGAFLRFSPGDFAEGLRALGIVMGDVVIVHSAYDAFHGFSGKPSDVIAAIEAVVGRDGVVMMPTMPFSGTAIAYVRTDPVFDVRRTPSRMGLLTELFRRAPGVMRSVHPTHPVAGCGRVAAEFLADHWKAKTPCGAGTPYARLLDRQGKILLLGTGIGVLTFYHALEELLEDRLPFSPFTAEVYRLQSIASDGAVVLTETRLFDPEVSRRRNLERLGGELRRAGRWRQVRVGGLSMVALTARDVRSTVSEMAGRGAYCYD